MSTNNPETSPETPKVSEKIPETNAKVSENSNPTLGTKPKVSEKPTEKIVTEGKVSRIVTSETPKVSGKDPKVSGKNASETPNSRENQASETKEVSKPKRKMTPKQLANLKRGNAKPPKPEEEVPETSPETSPKGNFSFPIKFIVIAAFVAGATIGGIGLWKWWQNSKKKKVADNVQYTDIPEELLTPVVPQNITQEEIEKLARIEAAQENFN
ncbi:MAG: hypothetical protein KDC82_00070 [Bacteroidetes bacterium]|nr:hypothetical protein [Bacteroidota bacterium]